MNKFWLFCSIGVGLFWGLLIGLITASIITGIIIGGVGFFVNMTVGGLCLMAGEEK